jgi:hypothetical protein
MTTDKPSEPKRSVYDTCDPQYLRTLREASGMDLVVLARTACLSVAQVRQLESDDNEGLFYSDAIKRQAYKRVLMILGAEPPTVELPHELRDAHKVAEAHINTLDQIVAMSHQPSMNRSMAETLRAGLHQVLVHKQLLAALMFLVVAVVLFVLHGPQSAQDVPDAALVSAPAPALTASVSAPKVVEPAASLAATPWVAPVASVPVSAASMALVAPVAVAASTPITVVASPSPMACADSSETMPQLTPFVAHKEARYVYLVSAVQTEVCVVDGHKQVTVVKLKAGENRSVYGASPWQISTPQLQKIQIYFQGGRVSLPDGVTRVRLVEAPVAH